MPSPASSTRPIAASLPRSPLTPRPAPVCDLKLDRDAIGQQFWVPDPGETPADLCARIFAGRSLPAVCEYNTDMTFEDVVGAMQDAARLDSIRDVAVSGAPSLLMDRATNDPTARGWFHTEICSSRRYNDPVDPPGFIYISFSLRLECARLSPLQLRWQPTRPGK